MVSKDSETLNKMSTFLKNCRRIISDVPSRLSSAGVTSNESCENCHNNFHVLRKKRNCTRCYRCFCSDCLLKRDMSCHSCSILVNWPQRPQLLKLRVKDIKAFLAANGVSTHGCVEKEELVELALHYIHNRNQPDSSRNVADHIVEDSFVLVSDQACSTNNEASSSSHIETSDTPIATDSSVISDSSCEQSSLNVPRRSLENSASLSSSMPHLNSLDEDSDEGNNATLVRESSISESQPNLLSQQSESSMDVNEASGSSQYLKPQETILSMSRTDIAQLTEDDINKLSIRNLKVVLASHRVDFRGCCEKNELLERVYRLREQLQAHANIDVDELSDANLCKVCMSAPIDCVLLDCGHLVTCTACGKQMNECPVCRQYVIRVVKIFRA